MPSGGRRAGAAGSPPENRGGPRNNSDAPLDEITLLPGEVPSRSAAPAPAPPRGRVGSAPRRAPPGSAAQESSAGGGGSGDGSGQGQRTREKDSRHLRGRSLSAAGRASVGAGGSPPGSSGSGGGGGGGSHGANLPPPPPFPPPAGLDGGGVGNGIAAADVFQTPLCAQPAEAAEVSHPAPRRHGSVRGEACGDAPTLDTAMVEALDLTRWQGPGRQVAAAEPPVLDARGGDCSLFLQQDTGRPSRWEPSAPASGNKWDRGPSGSKWDYRTVELMGMGGEIFAIKPTGERVDVSSAKPSPHVAGACGSLSDMPATPSYTSLEQMHDCTFNAPEDKPVAVAAPKARPPRSRASSTPHRAANYVGAPMPAPGGKPAVQVGIPGAGMPAAHGARAAAMPAPKSALDSAAEQSKEPFDAHSPARFPGGSDRQSKIPRRRALSTPSVQQAASAVAPSAAARPRSPTLGSDPLVPPPGGAARSPNLSVQGKQNASAAALGVVGVGERSAEAVSVPAPKLGASPPLSRPTARAKVSTDGQSVGPPSGSSPPEVAASLSDNASAFAGAIASASASVSAARARPPPSVTPVGREKAAAKAPKAGAAPAAKPPKDAPAAKAQSPPELHAPPGRSRPPANSDTCASEVAVLAAAAETIDTRKHAAPEADPAPEADKARLGGVAAAGNGKAGRGLRSASPGVGGGRRSLDRVMVLPANASTWAEEELGIDRAIPEEETIDGELPQDVKRVLVEALAGTAVDLEGICTTLRATQLAHQKKKKGAAGPKRAAAPRVRDGGAAPIGNGKQTAVVTGLAPGAVAAAGPNTDPIDNDPILAGAGALQGVASRIAKLDPRWWDVLLRLLEQAEGDPPGVEPDTRPARGMAAGESEPHAFAPPTAGGQACGVGGSDGGCNGSAGAVRGRGPRPPRPAPAKAFSKAHPNRSV